MEIVVFSEPENFRRVAEPFLLASEAENNLMVGITIRLCERGTAFYSDAGEKAFMALVKDGDEVAASAIRTPPYNLILSDGPSEAVKLIAETIISSGQKLPGFLGHKSVYYSSSIPP